ncbi:AMSH-like ubiquitin thioesterase 2 isoform X3 [Helianthus annuus]|uniref:AMSH-like ubiquitin thioesterase 2 isoform X3 n=1 Tax=Helianthus annuus TaxID=4232 RepID=UPI000B906BD3|nr:AMSH-like ubiquitin thioesterase 2 isoform X3 [Helianthus annuus]
MNKIGLTQPNLCKVTHSYPSPVISCIHKDPHASEVSRITSLSSENRHTKSFVDESTSNALKDVHIKGRTYYVTTLIIPKQDSTSSSCQAINEEEIFAIHNEQSLIPVGWIHTHPSQSCFMSSVDLHTQYSYQVMVPEAVAIVMAPTDTSRSHGFFRLSDPDGMNILRECQQTGFHTHKEPVNGTSIYEDCSSIYLNPNLRLEICDLRH